MKIAIVGAGVTGCALYLWLEKLGITSQHDITLYEARRQGTDASDADVSERGLDFGACIGIAPNGLNAIKNLSSTIYDKVTGTGNITDQWKLSTAKGWTLALVTDRAKGIMIGRWALWRCLRKQVPDAAVQYNKVVDISIGDESTTLVFADQTTAKVDFVVGADGIWSAVRKAMFDNKYPPHYEGLVGVGGLIPASHLRDSPPAVMNVIFGGNGFFGYGFHQTPTLTGATECSITSPNLPDQDLKQGCWWSTHSVDPTFVLSSHSTSLTLLLRFLSKVTNTSVYAEVLYSSNVVTT